MSNTHDLPRTRMLKRPTSSFRGGVMVSDDGARSWKRAGELPEAAFTHIILDPRSSPESRVLYATAMGQGVFKSENSGASWSLKSLGLPADPLAWRLTQDRAGALYVVLARRADNGTYGSPNDGFIYKSNDAGEHWSKLNLPPGLNGPTSIAVDPNEPSRLYVSAWSRTDPISGKHAQGGIFLSLDGGQTWQNTLARDQYVYDVSLDPKIRRWCMRLAFRLQFGGLSDRGDTWQRIRGFNFKNAHRVIPDPLDSSKIYVSTFGGSVWHGPAQGSPNAPEDIATPAASFHR